MGANLGSPFGPFSPSANEWPERERPLDPLMGLGQLLQSPVTDLAMKPLVKCCFFLSLILVIKGDHSVIINTKGTGFNVSSEIVTVEPLETVTISVTNITSQVKFVLVQVHHQTTSMCLALVNPREEQLVTGDFVRGKDIGLVVSLEESNETTTKVWLVNEVKLQLQVLIEVSLHTSNDPVPGGCNMEFEVEVSPFLRLTSDSVENRLEFQLARLGWPRGSTRPLPSCATSLSFIDYELYAYYLPADNYSVGELYHGTFLMSNIQTIVTNGHRIVTPKTWSPKTRIELLAYPGRGVVFNVVAVFGHQRVPYVPVSTYNCDFHPTRLDSCGKMNQLIAFILLSINALLGLVICFAGNTFFTLQVIWSSFFTTFILSYILIAEYSKVDEVTRETWSTVAAMAASLIWTLIYRLGRVKHFSVLTSGLLLGFLMVSTILFTAVGNEDLFRSDFNYWIIIACVSGAVALLLLPFPTFMSMFASSIGGSYAFIFTIDRLIGSSLGYIVLNILKRAAFKQLSMATNEVPFQGKDIAVSILWAILAFAGLFAQLYRYEGSDAPNTTEINGSSYMAFRVRVHRGRRSRNRSRGSRSRSRSRTGRRSASSSGRSGRRSRSKGTRTAVTNSLVNPQGSSAENRATSPSDDVQPLVVV